MESGKNGDNASRNSKSSTPALKTHLDALVNGFDYSASMQLDPIRFVHRWPAGPNREIVSLFAALLSYGRADLIGRAIEDAVNRMGPNPWQNAITDSRAQAEARFSDFVYRVTRGVDLARLWVGIGRVAQDKGSLGAFLRIMDHPSSLDLRPMLTDFRTQIMKSTHDFTPRRGFNHFLPNPNGGSAIKRYCMWLRWMVRGPDHVDLGDWSFLGTDRLTMPLDTHVHRISQFIGLTHRSQADWKTARAITERLRELDSLDPLRYDFAIAHMGISGHCTRVQKPDICRDCDLRGICTLPKE